MRRLVAAISIDLAGMSRREESGKIRRSLEFAVPNREEGENSPIFKDTGDGFHITVPPELLYVLMQYIDEIKHRLEILGRRFDQHYRIGVDVGFVDEHLSPLTNGYDGFSRCHVTAARLQEGARHVSSPPDDGYGTIVLSERVRGLFIEYHPFYFGEPVSFSIKNQSYYGYLFVSNTGAQRVSTTVRMAIYKPNYGIKDITTLCAGVLAVEDEPIILAGYKMLFESMLPAGRVYLTKNIDEAIEIVSLHPIDLIIADYRLRDGETAVMLISKLRIIAPDIPVVIVTGDTAVDRLRVAQTAGVPLIHKPFSAKQLLDVATSALAIRGTSALSWSDGAHIRKIRWVLGSLHKLKIASEIVHSLVAHSATNLVDQCMTEIDKNEGASGRLLETLAHQLMGLLRICDIGDTILDSNLEEQIQSIVNDKMTINPGAMIDFVVTGSVIPSLGADISVAARLCTTELIDNAIKHGSKNKNISVTLHRLESEQKILVTIGSRGKPITISHRGKMFECGVTSKQERGSGLGLYMLKGLLNRLSGQLEYFYADRMNMFRAIIPINEIEGGCL